MLRRFVRSFRAALVVLTAIALAGCQTTPRQFWNSLKGDGFPEWNSAMGGARGESADAKPSGFFTDRRSEQIEQNLGGGF